MTIRPWNVADSAALRPLLLAFLRDTYAEGYDFLPTEDNAEAFLEIGLEAATVGDPVLLAESGGEIIGFILWIGAPTFHIAPRARICVGMGTYVVPSRRRERIGFQLRVEGEEIARERGYTRLDGFGYYEAPKRLMERNGWHPVATLYQKELA